MLTDDQINDLQEKARRDDACTIFLPSDIRVILADLVTARALLADLVTARALLAEGVKGPQTGREGADNCLNMCSRLAEEGWFKRVFQFLGPRP